MAQPDESPAVDEETIEMLEGQVKKGKARKFFLIYKGASIKTLVVFKKGPFGPKIMKAKKNGFKGDVAYGVVTGSGKSLSFQIPANGQVAAAMKVDSWEEKPPAKTAKLREFLVDNGLKFKPTFEMVTKVGDALDPDAEPEIPDAPPLPGNDGSAAPPPPGDDQAIPAAPAPPDAAALSFMQLLKKLKPDMTKVIGAAVSVSQDVKLRSSEAAVFARKKEFDAGLEILNDVEELIKKGLAEMSATGGDSDGDRANLAADFKTRLTALVPQIKAAVGTPAGDEAKLKASEAGTFARKADFEQAIALLDQAEELLKQSSANPQAAKTSDTATVDPNAEFAKRKAELAEALRKLKPLIDKAIDADPGRKAELFQSMVGIAGEIKQGRLDDAKSNFVALDKLVQGLMAPTEAIRNTTPDDNDAELTASLQAWATARQTAVDQLSKLMAAFKVSNHPEAERGIILLQAIIKNLTPRPVASRQVMELVRYLETDDIIPAAETPNPFGFTVSIRTPLLNALTELRKQIA